MAAWYSMATPRRWARTRTSRSFISASPKAGESRSAKASIIGGASAGWRSFDVAPTERFGAGHALGHDRGRDEKDMSDAMRLRALRFARDPRSRGSRARSLRPAARPYRARVACPGMGDPA